MWRGFEPVDPRSPWRWRIKSIATRGFRSWATRICTPLAVAMLLDPSLGRYEAMQIEVETAGRVCEGMTVPIIDPEANNPVRVALDVDVARAEEFIVSRIASV